MLLLACVASGRAFGQAFTPAARPPEVWAIVVGVDDYTNPAIPDGRTSVRNAQQVRASIQRAGWDDRHQVLLSDVGSVEPGALAASVASINILPSRQNLDWAFGNGFPKNARPGDLVVFYFAGAVPLRGRHQETQLDVRHYLLPKDADPAKPEQTGWSLEGAVDDCVRNKLRVVCWLATTPGDPPPEIPASCPRRRTASHPARGNGRPGLPGCRGWRAGPG